jgi:hypothetical protein
MINLEGFDLPAEIGSVPADVDHIFKNWEALQNAGR